MIPVILNFFIFQAAWFITVLSAAFGSPVYGPFFTLLWIFFHLGVSVKNRMPELSLLIFAATIGYIFDSVQVLLGVMVFPEQAVLGSPSPIWMIALWINLAATLNLSMKWLHGKLIMSAILGAIAGPAAYYAGSKLGALTLFGPGSIVALSLQWFIAMPLLVWFAQRQNNQNTHEFSTLSIEKD
ncbi:MAG: hypothetical protein ACI9XC_002606 [Gammaproteobacteria bacterium]|jgi:hypothetical protein